MAQYIELNALVAEIDKRLDELWDLLPNASDVIKDNYTKEEANITGKYTALESFENFINTLEVEEVDLYNNGWIDCTKKMPPETKQTSDALQGHGEWTESRKVLVWDSMYGCGVDATKSGKWMSEQIGGYTGQIVHRIIAWRPIQSSVKNFYLKHRKENEMNKE